MLCVNISDIVIITFENVDYCCVIHNICKFDTIQKSVLDDRGYI